MGIPRARLFAAGKAFARYRASGGLKRAPLPDFFIGGHAEAASLPLITRDTVRYRSHFPSVVLISPGQIDRPSPEIMEFWSAPAESRRDGDGAWGQPLDERRAQDPPAGARFACGQMDERRGLLRLTGGEASTAG